MFALLDRLKNRDRRAGRMAIRRIFGDGRPTAFTHMLAESGDGEERVAQHLRLDRTRGLLFGTIERLDHDSAALARGLSAIGADVSVVRVADGSAHLLALESQQWWGEASYD